MSLWKTRPELSLELPPAVTLGRALEGVLVLEVPERLEVEEIKVTLRGETSLALLWEVAAEVSGPGSSARSR